MIYLRGVTLRHYHSDEECHMCGHNHDRYENNLQTDELKNSSDTNQNN